ncbi:MAG TPA: caspase family protein [Gemmataceae bacterium]|nr:caspase family protein [Gemmataceae bacterium]
MNASAWGQEGASRNRSTTASAQPDTKVQRLIRDLESPDASVRLVAAKELSKIGPSAQQAAPMLQKLRHDPDPDVRQMALTALARVTEAIMPSSFDRPDLYMLSVGVDSYKPPMNSLKGCVGDAEGMARLFQRQAGKGYGRVEVQVLTDANATSDKVNAGLAVLRGKGKFGDWYVILLSGHGGPKLNRWGFITHEGGDITDATLLDLADRLAGEGKKVMIILDACFAGQMRYAAHSVLNKYKDPAKGGIIVMISSMPAQTSAALQRYSAFARAVEEGLSGMADSDGDQKITLKELRRFTYNRVYELRLDKRTLPGLRVESQDSAIDASHSIAESTVLAQGFYRTPPPRDEGPFTFMPQLVGVWSTGSYRLRFDGNGIFRAAMSDSRNIQAGDGMYKANEKTVLLQHWQGEDRLEIVSLTSDEFRFRFLGQETVLRKEKATPPGPGSVAGTTWNGSETLSDYGRLTFHFAGDGNVTMIDAKSTVNGSWSQSGNRVTITFQNCVYEATVQGKSMSGNAHFTNGARTWTFAVTLADGTPPGTRPIATITGTVWNGTESLSGFGRLTFEFLDAGKAVMIDAQSTVEGRWSQAGDEVTITFGNCVYIGRIQGSILSGKARFLQGEPREWNFSATRAQNATPHGATVDAGTKVGPVYVVPTGERADRGTWIRQAPQARKGVASLDSKPELYAGPRQRSEVPADTRQSSNRT